ncbi:MULTISPECIES: hypothetical protein [Xanthomonas]|uniref:Uncharacterized protein n=1 Tax=Xanthomonas cucurbitae TaxID=56453 RepID=A0ABY7YC14_9XANT|nr:hypothetical protein [Xanthomonas cucurbitae]WDM67480.1 hypothetical protein K6981_18805 [Xanthomonas cucurbitae]WDM71356.1 hypothetical protein K6978_18770 [Xanthomonas cucurbitae]WDM75668.1 hypothetical protein K6982_01010 [Xanthomonas cucurbitae]WDM79372.1 hypothetical protein K6980_00995 [Xanthomonas cucurbitae]WDM83060.1 hypothetical protein K6979_01005 [Xanthomonas cucurbitae]
MTPLVKKTLPAEPLFNILQRSTKASGFRQDGAQAATSRCMLGLSGGLQGGLE